MLENLIKSIYEARLRKEKLEKDVAEIKEKIETLDKYIDDTSSELLNEMMTTDQTEYQHDGLIASRYKKESIGYNDEAAVVEYLKNNYDGKYIRTKITESLDKNQLKKAIKTDTELAQTLDSMTSKKVTEYVVVTTLENHQKMLEHMNESKQ